MFPSMIFFHAHDKAGIHRLRLDISFPTARLPASVLVPVYKLSVSRRHHSWTNTCFLCVRLRSLKETKNCHKNTFLFCQISKERLETLPSGWHLHRWPAGCKTQNTPQLCRVSQTSGAELPNQSNGLPVAAVTEGRKETPLCFWCI